MAYPRKSLLGQISDTTRNAILQAGTESEFVPGGIPHPDDRFLDVIFVLRGSLRVMEFSETGREVISNKVIEEGNCFGAHTALDGVKRKVGLSALTPLRVTTIPHKLFAALVDRQLDLNRAIMQQFLTELRDFNRRVDAFAEYDADERLMLELVDLFRRHEAPDGSALIKAPPTQVTLADFVFTKRETVARVFGRLMKVNLIERRARALYTPSVSKFVAYVNSRIADRRSGPSTV